MTSTPFTAVQPSTADASRSPLCGPATSVVLPTIGVVMTALHETANGPLTLVCLQTCPRFRDRGLEQTMMTNRNLRPWALAVLATAFLAACGSGSSDGEVTLVPGTAQIGAAGGAVTAADGASVQVPAGAFTTDATVSITREGSGAPALPGVAQPASAVYRITPHGGDFQRFVTVSIPVTASQVAEGAQLVLLTADPGESGWRMLSAATYVDGVMRAPVMKFSYFQVASLPNVRLPVLQTQIFRVSNAGFPGTQQVPADYEIAGQWGSFSWGSRDPDDIQDRIDAEARLRYEPVISRLRTASVAPRACLPSDYGPAGLRWSGLRDGVAASVATSHRLPWVAFNLSAQRPWPRTWNEAFVTTSGRDPAQTPPFASELLSSQRYPAAGFGTLHFYGQDSPRTGALIETSPGYIAVMPPAGNVPEDDHLSWYATVHLRPSDNGRWRFDAVVPTDCGIAVQAAPLSVRVNLRDTGIAAWRGGLQPNPTQNDDRDDLVSRIGTRIVDTGVTRRAVLGLPTTMQFTVTPSTWDSIYDPLEDSNPLRWTAFQELRSITWEYSADGNTWVARPDLAAKATPFPILVPDGTRLNLNATPLPYLSHYDLRIDEVVPQSAGYYRAFVCSRWLTKGKREPMSALRETASGCGAFGRFKVEVVSTPPSVTRQPASQTVMVGETATLVVAVDGLPAPAVQWEKRSFGDAFLNLPWTPIVGATTPSYTTPALTLADHPTYYRAVLSSAAGRAVSDVATVGVVQQLAPPVVTGQPGSLNLTVGGTAVFAVTVSGAAPLAYQWRRNGVDITGANSPVLTLSNVTALNDGQYTLAVSNRAGSAVSEPAALVVTLGTPVALPPTLANQPGPLSVPAGSAANFAVGVSGSGPFTYAWYRGSSTQPIADTPSLAFIAVSPADAGSYTVRVTNTAGTVLSSAATLTVTPATETPTAPRIVTAPANVAAFPGAGATFVVAATGSGPLAYQWRFNGSDIPNATGPVLSLSGVLGPDAGQYTVEVRNGVGAALSSAAQLVLIGAPAISTHPAAANATVGGTASFSVTATGDLLRYQWMRNGQAIPGASAATYTTPALSLADHGAVYAVVVYNGAGVAFSGGAALSVSAAPAASATVLSLDFEGAIPASVNMGDATVEAVQGFAGLGPAGGSTFAGNMLRSRVGNTVTITLNNLPSHRWLSLDFLFAAIDSLDGTGAFPSGDFFRVTVDGVEVFRESFANAIASQIQSYVPPSGVLLARQVDLGFSGPGGYYTDSAYWMGGDPAFSRIAHTASSVTITFVIEGVGAQDIADESWGIDNLRVVVEP